MLDTHAVAPCASRNRLSRWRRRVRCRSFLAAGEDGVAGLVLAAGRGTWRIDRGDGAGEAVEDSPG